MDRDIRRPASPKGEGASPKKRRKVNHGQAKSPHPSTTSVASLIEGGQHAYIVDVR